MMLSIHGTKTPRKVPRPSLSIFGRHDFSVAFPMCRVAVERLEDVRLIVLSSRVGRLNL